MVVFMAQRSVPSTSSYLQTSASFSVQDLGRLLTCFSLTYALSKLACGFLYDNLGLSPKTLFCWGLGASGLLCLLFPAAASSGVALTCLLWSLAGVFQGLGWPACAQMTKEWYSSSELGKRYSVLSASSNLAAAASPVVSAYVASFMGWEAVYYLLGAISLVVTAVLVMCIEYRCQKREESFQNGHLGRAETCGVTEYSWRDVFLFREFWLVMALNATVLTVKASVMDWMQLYITQEMNLPHSTAALCASIAEIGAVVGKLSFAILSDYLLSNKLMMKRDLCPRAPLLLVLSVLLALSSHLYSSQITQDSTKLWVMLVLFVFGFSAGGALGMCGLSLMESVPPALSATSLGIGDCLGQLVGRSLLGYTVFSYLANHPLWGWSAGYRITGALSLTSAGTALLLFLSPPTSLPTHKNKQQ